MKVDEKAYRTIWLAEDGWRIRIIDQTRLPHEFVLLDLESVEQVAEAIKSMRVRGAPLIGATAAYGIAVAMYHSPTTEAPFVWSDGQEWKDLVFTEARPWKSGEDEQDWLRKKELYKSLKAGGKV